MQPPKLEKSASSSRSLDALTVIAFGTRAGEVKQASFVSFPDATTTVIPELIKLLTLLSNKDCAGPPRLIFTTAGTPLG